MMKVCTTLLLAALFAPLGVLAVPASARAPSGSTINAFTDDNCQSGYFTLKDEPGDGVQGTNCFNTWIRGQDNGAVYQTVQSFNTENLQGGCVAHIYKNLDCQGEVATLDSQTDGCQRNYGNWYGLSAQITCQ